MPAKRVQPAAKPSSEALSTGTATKNVTVTFPSGGLALQAYLCTPADASASLPAVIFNHGGFGPRIGGAPEETCRALAQAGFVGFSPIRRKEISLEGNLEDLLAAVDYLKGLSSVDSGRIGIIGFSRGGLLSAMAASRRPTDFAAVVLMAPAPPRPGAEEEFYSQVKNVRAPILLLVAENDLPPYNQENQDHVALTQKLHSVLQGAGREAKLILYPPYREDGHRIFFEVGDYWNDVSRFLKDHLHDNEQEG
jgi:dienelactone hydrolase